MSILVEALTIVAQKLTLDVTYPGGADAWIERHVSASSRARYVSQDKYLVGVSFFTDYLQCELTHLEDSGLVFMDQDTFVEFAVVDQERGLVYECEWLSSEKASDGIYSVCWRSGRDPGDLAAPPGWVPGASALVSTDDRAHPGMKLLARDGRKQAWLDTLSGRILEFPDEEPTAGPILQKVMHWMDESGHETQFRLGGWASAIAVVAGMKSEFRIETVEDRGILSFALVLPITAPGEDSYSLIERMDALGGHFDLEPGTGQLRTRIVIRMEDGVEVPSDGLLQEALDELRGLAVIAAQTWAEDRGFLER